MVEIAALALVQASSTSVICGRRQTTPRLFKNTFEPCQYGEEEDRSRDVHLPQSLFDLTSRISQPSWIG